ncbi:hypothetical protein ES708_05811 [subsurface metagenome]
MKIEIKEMPRASEGDSIEIEGNVIRALKPNEGEYGWSQFIVVKDSTGEQGAWLKLDSEGDKVTKGSPIKVKGKVSKEYKDNKGVMKRSLNNCTFEGEQKAIGKTQVDGRSDMTKEDWEAKELRMIKMNTLNRATDLLCADKIELEDTIKYADRFTLHVYSNMPGSKVKTETKEGRIKKADEVVGETRFKPASTLQKDKIFGYRDNIGWHKGMIESRFITKEEIRKIGSPEKLSVEKASEWLSWWWGADEEVGERGKREIEAQDDSPIEKNLRKEEPIIKGDKTSVAKDILVDEVHALRRENFLSDDEKFKEEMGYDPKLEELSEKDLIKLKEILQHYHPKSWNGDK